VFSLTDVVTAVEEEEERGGAKNHFSPEQSSPDEPLMEDPEWSDFVMSHFTPNELDPQGCPKVHGLRRVSRKLLGPVLYSGANVVKATEFVPGLENVGQLQPVTVEYTLKILMVRECPTGMDGYEVTYKDVADAYFANTDPDFLYQPATYADSGKYVYAFATAGGAVQPAIIMSPKRWPYMNIYGLDPSEEIRRVQGAIGWNWSGYWGAGWGLPQCGVRMKILP
jgi:hypothetical protein